MIDLRFVELDEAEPDDTVVVVDVLRAFTVEPWLFARGAARIIAVDTREGAKRLREEHLPDALLAGEQDGRPVPGFDLGNSPSEVAAGSFTAATVVHRTSAGTQGLARTIGSGAVFAASFVNAAATVAAVRARGPQRVTFVITGASLGRDGDEDLAAAELIGARLLGQDPDPAPLVARVGSSDAGRIFAPDGPDWAPPADLALACEVDRFDMPLLAAPPPDLVLDGVTIVEVTRLAAATG